MSRASILIVEDEIIIAENLAGKLKQLGYAVAGIAARGHEAVEMALATRPQLILMDISLDNDFDGIQAAEAIRGHHDAPVIYLTAHSDPATLQRAKITGPFGYILKPFEERDLATQIELAFYKHQADRRVREQREWFKGTLASIGDAVIAADVEGTITFLNPVAEALTGWPAGEAVGKPLDQVFTIVDEDTRAPVDDPVTKVLATREVVGLSNRTVLLGRGGAETPIDNSGAPIRDGEGRIQGVVMVFRDITERKRADEALRESEARLSAILKQLPVGVGLVDAEGRVILRNQVMQGYMPGMIPSRDPERRWRWHAADGGGHPVPPDQWPGARALRGESVVPGREFDYLDDQGRELRLMVSAVPFTTKAGTTDAAIVVAQDITDTKKAERALRDTNEELSEYTYAVVHNVKAPFRAVENYANFLIEDLGGRLEGEPEKFLKGIKSALGQASLQFRDLDALYQLRAYAPDFEPLDMRTLLTEIAAHHRTIQDRKLVFPDQWPGVMSEPFLLRQILSELIHNGFKYNRSEVKTVHVGWRQTADNRLEISVRDNGIGIDPRYHEHIFHIFKRLHTEQEYEGTGIGLAIVRRAVKKIGGKLRIESAAGQGSTFVMNLPVRAVAEEPS